MPKRTPVKLNIIEIKTGDGSIQLTEHELPYVTKGEYLIKWVK